ncbi:O-acetylhomoserine aminocarboxypropyltransferase/cysteine synthase family protein [Ectothiorhodospira lacustris]|uniref:O-acetylhomoserine aminocarboxypropyltransferase/cysteine synthase family protein n=1 Tax=Ectothiorhodospira lacustris TaxID=2899127 RepID=UPI001EE7C0D9|nr:O-acetylhomoserine aminocarboxypropyltransferase/cysteine synthase family protein [Ectothiorhodospira lacustris]MCG5501981.1 O-acetylhomoserine aminocarboxypropyltransferase/cysteine synthase [Ectothiorhodospira lacustris]
MTKHEYGFDTLCLHAGQVPDAATGSRAVPVYQTTSYVFDSPEHAASLFNLQTFGNVYSRLSNPTVAVLEERIAALENGRAAVATGSGMAAQMIALLNICEAGDEIVASRTLYGGTHTQLDISFRKLGIKTLFVDPDDPENFARAINPRTKVVYAEILGNPSLNVLDIEAVSRIANQAGLPLFIDSTFASPYLCQPFRWGATLSLHSATKFIGGHGTSMGGIIVESGNFPWDNGHFPCMTDPSPGYHGVRFYETFGDFGFTMKCRMEGLRTFGPALSPFNAFLLLQGVETLPLRMERHCSNALAVARFLQGHPKVSWVNYPGLDDSRYRDLARKYLPKGAGAVLTFGIRGGAAAGQKFIDNVEFLSHLANIGDAKTLVIHPASTTHRQLSEEQQIAAGVPPDLIRVSVGLETIDDILWDIDQALSRVG